MSKNHRTALVMCTWCGEFVYGTKENGSWTALGESCPKCGNESFKRASDD